MTEQHILNLYGLRGHVNGMMTGAKAGIESTTWALGRDPSELMRQVFLAERRERISALSSLNQLRRIVSSLIKEAEDAEEQADLPF